MTAPATAVGLDALGALGLSWQPSGQAGLRGPLLRLAYSCDRAFSALAARWGAEEERHPASLPAAGLERVDYLRSFPHQATFPAALDPTSLDGFAAAPPVDADGVVAVNALAPITDVLTPAACYHLYHGREGTQLDRPMYLTTRNTCFRRETEYLPLRRQWSFTMREIVCLGTGPETAAFLRQARDAVDALLGALDLPVRWLAATDPFFQPAQHPQYLMQKIQPSKHEATYGGDLAIASANRHHDHFGEAFGISRSGAPAHSACIAFGVERWLYAVVDRHGPDPAAWPDPAAALGTGATG